MKTGWLWPVLRRATLRANLHEACASIPNDLLERVVPQLIELIEYEIHIEDVRNQPAPNHMRTRIAP